MTATRAVIPIKRRIMMSPDDVGLDGDTNDREPRRFQRVGISRPFRDVVADPTPNLTVQLFRQPRGEWLGIRAQTRWQPAAGLGLGSGTLLDSRGGIGRVSMSVVLVPFPKPGPAAD
jgi:hypothetical protein